jgi:hypothetical protein
MWLACNFNSVLLLCLKSRMTGDPVSSYSQHRTTYRHETLRENSVVIQHTMTALMPLIRFYPHGVTRLHKQHYGRIE